MSALRDIAIALKQVLLAPLDENCDAVDKLDAIRVLRDLRAEGVIKFVEEVPQNVSPLIKAHADAGWTHVTSDFTQQEARIHARHTAAARFEAQAVSARNRERVQKILDRTDALVEELGKKYSIHMRALEMRAFTTALLEEIGT